MKSDDFFFHFFFIKYFRFRVKNWRKSLHMTSFMGRRHVGRQSERQPAIGLRLGDSLANLLENILHNHRPIPLQVGFAEKSAEIDKPRQEVTGKFGPLILLLQLDGVDDSRRQQVNIPVRAEPFQQFGDPVDHVDFTDRFALKTGV